MHFRKMHFRKFGAQVTSRPSTRATRPEDRRRFPAGLPARLGSKILQIFGGLVLGCIKTKFCKKICVRQHFSSSTRFASFCTVAISKFSQKIGLKKPQFSWKFSKKLQMSQNLQNFVKFQKFQFENLVDFEKCCQTHIFLQKSEPIQPKTSNILPKFCQPTLSDVSGRRYGNRVSLVLSRLKLGEVVHASEGSLELGDDRHVGPALQSVGWVLRTPVNNFE